jgi:hypothetical protein
LRGHIKDERIGRHYILLQDKKSWDSITNWADFLNRL